MTKFPEPPSRAKLEALGPDRYSLRAGALLWRVYFRRGAHPTSWNEFRRFGPTDSRFDHHEPPPRLQDRAVMYAAEFGPSAIAEVFQATRTVDRTLGEPWLVAFRTRRTQTLLDLTGTWPTRAGASTAIHSGSRARARRWSMAIYAAYSSIEGLAYCSSMDANRQVFAFYERARDLVPKAPEFHRALSDRALEPYLEAAALRFGYALV